MKKKMIDLHLQHTVLCSVLHLLFHSKNDFGSPVHVIYITYTVKDLNILLHDNFSVKNLETLKLRFSRSY